MKKLSLFASVSFLFTLQVFAQTPPNFPEKQSDYYYITETHIIDFKNSGLGDIGYWENYGTSQKPDWFLDPTNSNIEYVKENNEIYILGISTPASEVDMCVIKKQDFKLWCIIDLLENYNTTGKIFYDPQINTNGKIKFKASKEFQKIGGSNEDNIENYLQFEIETNAENLSLLASHGKGLKLEKINNTSDSPFDKFFIKPSPFTDLPPTHPLYDHVLQAVDDGWINGYPDNTIQLDKTVNRAEFAKMLIKAFKHSDGDSQNLNKFPDVEINSWYAPLLSKAINLGLMKGYPDGTMKPNQTINAAEGLKMTLSLLSQEIPDVSGEWFEKYRSFAVKNLKLTTMKLEAEDMNSNITRGMAIELISLVQGL